MPDRAGHRTGYTVTVWVDAPGDWNAERVREEVDAMFAHDRRTQLTLNTVHTPKPEKGLGDDRPYPPPADEACQIVGHGDHYPGEGF